ncbi:Microprocessor complex subunit dgcr8 [Bulinus truncatus]|nr:Microprocessor complex subunit dgcr8 [Bulinus truncatus]
MSDDQVDISQVGTDFSMDTVEDNGQSDLYENDDDNSNHDDDYGDPGEEHEFEIIDQIESEDDDGNGLEKNDPQRKDDQDDYSSSSDDLDDTELHAMLEKGIDKDSIKKTDENQDGRPIIKHKIVLNELESDPFDILPEGWVWVTHNCGMPVYLHKETRVCTMARPYSLGSASARTHNIPISAIPCLQYRKQLGKLKSEKEGNDKCKEGDSIDVDKKVSKDDSLENIAALPVEVGNETSLKPVVHMERKSPGKIWAVAEESTEFKISDTHHGALHTGVSDYRVLNYSEIDTAETTLLSVGENIAVSLDTSCLDQSDHTEASPPGQNVNNSSNPSVSENLAVVVSNKCLESPLKLVVDVPMTESISANSDQIQSSHQSLTCPYHQNTPVQKQRAPSNDPFTVDDSGSCPHETIPKANGVDEITKQTTPVVTEEATSSTERSELVTSSTNPLASIKRKIESLKHKRGGKQRKLDKGSAIGWPTENNIAVSASSGRDDAFNAPQIPNADEKLKAHAAEVKIKSAEERAKESLLDSSTIHSYCTRLFQFKTLEVKKYRSWRERRKHLGERSRRNRPELPPSTKLITCPIPSNVKADGTGDNTKKREFILNPTGKSYLCILHEYMQRTLKIQPLYVFKELENSKTPYGATVMINNIEYGTGYASSKKVAKQEAAKETLKVLIPDLFKKITDQEIKRNISDLSFFDDVKVTDPRVNELGNKVGQPSPFQLLLECLRRNFGMGNTQCEVSTKPLKNQKCEFTINVGKHSSTVVAKNKREGKQLAAQAILAKLHPHVPSWGSLLRLYGTSVEKAIQKPEEMSDAKNHAPNHSVLESLREEMRKLHRQKEAIQSKGKMIISSKDLPSKMSGVDL